MNRKIIVAILMFVIICLVIILYYVLKKSPIVDAEKPPIIIDKPTNYTYTNWPVIKGGSFGGTIGETLSGGKKNRIFFGFLPIKNISSPIVVVSNDLTIQYSVSLWKTDPELDFNSYRLTFASNWNAGNYVIVPTIDSQYIGIVIVTNDESKINSLDVTQLL